MNKTESTSTNTTLAGERIRSLRKNLGLTQAELAKILGIKDSAVAKYEKGRVTNLKRSTIQKMAELFDVSPSYIMGLEESDKQNKLDTYLVTDTSGSMAPYTGNLSDFVKNRVPNVSLVAIPNNDVEFIEKFKTMNEDGKKEVKNYTDYIYDKYKIIEEKPDNGQNDTKKVLLLTMNHKTGKLETIEAEIDVPDSKYGFSSIELTNAIKRVHFSRTNDINGAALYRKNVFARKRITKNKLIIKRKSSGNKEA